MYIYMYIYIYIYVYIYMYIYIYITFIVIQPTTYKPTDGQVKIAACSLTTRCSLHLGRSLPPVGLKMSLSQFKKKLNYK